MDLENFTSQIELEIERRLSEINKLYNVQSVTIDIECKNALRRSSICLYYAHIEGFVYFIFLHYINAINRSNSKAKDVIDEIKAANYHLELGKLFLNTKHPFFRRPLPNDTHLHSLSRQIEFFSDIAPLWADTIINIDDGFIDTENNVGKEVIQKLLYKVGLNYGAIHSTLYSSLAQLLNIRNDIAHGANLSPITDDHFNRFYECTKSIISELKSIITDAYAHKKFLTSTVSS